MTRVGIAGIASYLPDRWMTAADVATASGIPEGIVVDKFGLRGKHIAATDQHVSDLAVAAAERLLGEHDVDPASIDVVVYYGSQWKDYAIWQAAPWIAHRLGCVNAFGLEFDNVSHGTPMALRLCRDYLAAEPELHRILAVAASRESYLLDYTNERSRFMFNFGDGAAAALIERDHPANEILASHAITDGSLSLQVKVPSGGSVEPPWSVDGNGQYHLDVADPAAMKQRLDETSLDNFAAVAERALGKAGLTLADVSLLAGIHMKRSMHDVLLERLGVDPAGAPYLDDTGHMSGVDPLLALDRAVRGGEVSDGDVVLLLAAGTGYTWAATVVRWGPA